jgi:hypothetical protein
MDLQVQTCFNDARQNPLKYKPFFPCQYDKDIAPRLAALTGGRRLPLTGKGTSTAASADGLAPARTLPKKEYTTVPKLSVVERKVLAELL